MAGVGRRSFGYNLPATGDEGELVVLVRSLYKHRNIPLSVLAGRSGDGNGAAGLLPDHGGLWVVALAIECLPQ